MQEDEILHPEEVILGRYTGEIARYVNDRYDATLPSLYVLVTDKRIIMWPQVRKKYEPAVIYGKYISGIGLLKSRRSGVSLRIKNGYVIHLFVQRNRISEFMSQVRDIAKLPPLKEYHLPLSDKELNRIISFFEEFPVEK